MVFNISRETLSYNNASEVGGTIFWDTLYSLHILRVYANSSNLD